MATKGDISDLDVLEYGGKPMIPLVSGFSRYRRSGVVQSTMTAGRTRQRKKFYGNTYVADAQFFFQTPQQQDFIKLFFERNEGKTFVCHLSADRPIIEPYTVRVISDWSDDTVTSKYGTMSVTLEIDSVRCTDLDDFLYSMYGCRGDDLYEIFALTTDGVLSLPSPWFSYRITIREISLDLGRLGVQVDRLKKLTEL